MTVQRAEQLTSEEIAEVLALAAAASDTDGTDPLSEHAVLRLRHAGPAPAVHLLARDDGGALAGYGYVEVAEGAAELVVHPLRRRRGLGHALATAVVAEAGTAGRLRVWAHGDHPSAAALALRLGFERVRVLWRMRRPLTAPVPEPTVPDGVRLRAFRPGADDAAWLALNARAFADHPEQGRWTPDDLRVRLAEPWFDPDGFLLAERAGQLLGFHWTKVHPGPPPLGEVYVLGVDPAAQGLGLGAALTAAGLRHLRSRGLDQVMLYVEETNTAALALYTRLGFARWSADVSYERRVRA